MREPRVRGAAYLSAVAFIVERYGRAALDQVLARLPASCRAVIDRDIDRGAWEPFPAWVELIETADRVLGTGDLAIAREGGRWAARKDLPETFPELARRGAVREIVELASRFWGFYYDGGRAEAVVSDVEDAVLFEVIGFPTPHRVHCQRVLGWIGGAFSVIGVQVDMTMPSCRADGDERCLFLALGRDLGIARTRG